MKPPLLRDGKAGDHREEQGKDEDGSYQVEDNCLFAVPETANGIVHGISHHQHHKQNGGEIMVNKGNAAYAHPGNILGGIGEKQETGFLIPLSEPAVEDEKRTGDSDPPDRRIAHTADGADQGVADGIVGVQKRHPHNGPFVERGAVIMLRYQLGMVFEHGDGAPDGLVDQAFIWRMPHNRKEGEGIHDKGNRDKEDAAEPEQPCGLFFGKMGQGVPEKEDSKACARIHARPFGGDSKGHGKAAETKGRKHIHGELRGRLTLSRMLERTVPAEIFVQEIIHQKDEKGGKNVNGGNAGERVMHTVKGKQRRACRGDKGTAEQLFCEQVHHRKDQDAEEYGHKAPAKGRHPK